MHLDPSFSQAVAYLNLESIRTSRDVVYIVDQAWRLRAFNAAWVRFAEDNDGRAILERYPLGADIAAAFPNALKDYFLSGYTYAMQTNRPFEHDYECPSSRQYRKFHQSAYPLLNAAGLVISNHLVELRSHDENRQDFSDRFVDHNGIVTQCCNCRKLRDPSDATIWLWVPEALDIHGLNTSHGICPRCYDFYYPDIDDE